MHARRTAHHRPNHVIEGRAVVLNRSGAVPIRPAVLVPEPWPTNDNDAGLLPYRSPRPASPDLVFPGHARFAKAAAAPRRGQADARAARPADDAARGRASVGVMVALVASLSAWSMPDLPDAQHSTLGLPSATTGAGGVVSGSGKGDRITFGK
ncbi:hypothetical protein [Aureimonas psammosilenae]|uniref:hypothetical protein n=1 Tax=Aureimonas psammosilenae TaxID=2495496 RepID=UPI0012610AB7|nr:hypothetical protein [Aureimonas psammosilenae]